MVMKPKQADVAVALENQHMHIQQKSKKLKELLKEKLKKQKGNVFNYIFGFVIFIGILFYTTNIPAAIIKILEGFTGGGQRRNSGGSGWSRTPMHFLSSSDTIEDETDMDSTDSEIMKCNLPKLNPLDPTIVEFIKPPPEIDCTAEYPKIFRTNFESKLIQMKENVNLKCCYRSLQRKGNLDSALRFSKLCYPITEEITEISSLHEFIQVMCKLRTNGNGLSTGNQKLPEDSLQNFTDLFAFVPRKLSVDRRIKKYYKSLVAKGEKKPKTAEKLNVIILGLDAQSRMNFIRQMPLAHSYLMQNLSAIEMRGYTKVGDNTFPNVVPLLSGLNISELSTTCWQNKRTTYFDKCPFIWKDYASSGYRTSYAEDSVWMGTFNYDKKGFLNPPTDYYLNPMTLQMSKAIGHEVWGNAKLCYGPRLSFEVLLDYLVKSAVAFTSQKHPYFQFIWANSLFHDYLNHPKLGDELFALTLNFLNSNNFLNNSVFILLSDHGMRWGSIRSTYQGKLEERMPMAYFVFPPWFKSRYAFALSRVQANVDKLATPFDIYETLKDILNLRGSIISRRNILKREKVMRSRSPNRGISLFLKIPNDRTCKLAQIEEHWCVCNTMQTISKELPIVQMAANFVVEIVNKIIVNHSQCAKLELKKINSVLRKIDGDLDNGADGSLFISGPENLITNGNNNTPSIPMTPLQAQLQIQFQLTLVTSPGDAVFEATVNGNIGNWHLSGEISRLNLYRSSSFCITDQIVQKYCYCGNEAEE